MSRETIHQRRMAAELQQRAELSLLGGFHGLPPQDVSWDTQWEDLMELSLPGFREMRQDREQLLAEDANRLQFLPVVVDSSPKASDRHDGSLVHACEEVTPRSARLFDVNDSYSPDKYAMVRMPVKSIFQPWTWCLKPTLEPIRNDTVAAMTNLQRAIVICDREVLWKQPKYTKHYIEYILRVPRLVRLVTETASTKASSAGDSVWGSDNVLASQCIREMLNGYNDHGLRVVMEISAQSDATENILQIAHASTMETIPQRLQGILPAENIEETIRRTATAGNHHPPGAMVTIKQTYDNAWQRSDDIIAPFISCCCDNMIENFYNRR